MYHVISKWDDGETLVAFANIPNKRRAKQLMREETKVEPAATFKLVKEIE
jgi:hypothetical protein